MPGKFATATEAEDAARRFMRRYPTVTGVAISHETGGWLTDVGRDGVSSHGWSADGAAHEAHPAFDVIYRRYRDTQSSFLRVQAKDERDVMSALTAHVGGTQYVVTSIRRVPAGTDHERDKTPAGRTHKTVTHTN
ncbi:hypothetical protein ACFCZ6_14465 [Streptomyces hydrogenans]|uniref:hypothetical protein n=1 Tax=Streptomyces hydrogenans TaxID=1873719 RepID=UPI0035DC22C3